MKTPVDTPKEIIAEALADAHDIDMTDDLYAAAILRKLEAAGYRLLCAETTPPMDNAVADYFSGSLSDWRRCWSDLHAAAPQWSKGSEG